ncbi:MAG TPA: hypothetical protein VGM95_06005 [Lactobacillaceae bacterium]|jgi:phenylpyruvate tautomerase PptA (4-oxalocrotonate tautomerase family)
MPMIDIYAKPNTFAEPQKLAQATAQLVMTIEAVPNIAMFRQNTAGFIHENTIMSNVDGDDDYIRVQVLTNVDALSREQQLALTSQMTDLVANATTDPDIYRNKIWVLLTQAVAGGWGLAGHAHTNEELVAAARAEIAKA